MEMNVTTLKQVKQLPRDVRMFGYVNASAAQAAKLYQQRFGTEPVEAYQVDIGGVQYVYVVHPRKEGERNDR